MQKINAPNERHHNVGSHHHVSAPVSSTPLKRVREPIKNYCGLFRGKFPSRKTGRMVHWESLLERDAALLFEFSPGVISFREQPCKIFYNLDGRIRRYTPDFEITLTNGEILIVEVKPAVRLQRSEEKHRFSRITQYFSERGYRFILLTDEMIRQPILLRNLRILCRYRRENFSEFERRCWLERLNSFSNFAFADLVTLIGKEDEVWRLIEQRVLDVDLRMDITADTLLHTEIKGRSDEKLYF